eukprot:INCI3312.1.p1 GENE.INCI3312.1~~INCI3312.1.p1  ORF type:complete len:2079 (-),score=238.96 INCI3312.1:325-6561(-)
MPSATLRAGDDVLLSSSVVGRVDDGARPVQAARVVSLGGSPLEASACTVTLYYHPEDTRFGRECFHSDYHEIFLPVNGYARASSTAAAASADSATGSARLDDASNARACHSDRNRDRIAVLPDCTSVLKKVLVAPSRTATAPEMDTDNEQSERTRYFCLAHYSWALDLYFRKSDFPSASDRAIAVKQAARGNLPPTHYCHRCRRYVGTSRRGSLRLTPCPNSPQKCSKYYCNDCKLSMQGAQCCCSCNSALKCIRCRLHEEVPPHAPSPLSLESQSPSPDNKSKRKPNQCTDIPLVRRVDKLMAENLHGQVLQRMALVGSVIRAHFVPAWPDGKVGCRVGEVFFSRDSDSDDIATSGDTQPHCFECDGIIRAYSVATGQHLVEWLGRHQRIFLGNEVISVGPEQEAVCGASWLTLRTMGRGVPPRGKPANPICIAVPDSAACTPPSGSGKKQFAPACCWPAFVAEANLSMYLPEHFQLARARPKAKRSRSKLLSVPGASSSTRPPTSRFVLSATAWLLPDEQLHCICRRPEYLGIEAVECVKCKEWFHAECLGVTDEEVDLCMDGARDWYCAMCDLTRTDEDDFAEQTALAAGGRQKPRATPPSLDEAVGKVRAGAIASATPKPAPSVKPSTLVLDRTSWPMMVRVPAGAMPGTELVVERKLVPGLRVQVCSRETAASQHRIGVHREILRQVAECTAASHARKWRSAHITRIMTKERRHSVDRTVIEVEFEDGCREMVPRQRLSAGPPIRITVPEGSAPGDQLELDQCIVSSAVDGPEHAGRSAGLNPHVREAPMESLDGWEGNAAHWSEQEQDQRRTHQRLEKYVADAERRVWAHLVKCTLWVSEMERARTEAKPVMSGLHVCKKPVALDKSSQSAHTARQMRRLASKLHALYRDNSRFTWTEFEQFRQEKRLECSNDSCQVLQFSFRRFWNFWCQGDEGFAELQSETLHGKLMTQCPPAKANKLPLTVCSPDANVLGASAITSHPKPAAANLRQGGRSEPKKQTPSVAEERSDISRSAVAVRSSGKASVSKPPSRRTSPRRSTKQCALCQTSPDIVWSQQLKTYICRPCQRLGNSPLPPAAVTPKSSLPQSTHGFSSRLSPWGRAALAQVAALEDRDGSHRHSTSHSTPVAKSPTSKRPRPPLSPSQGTPHVSTPTVHSTTASDGSISAATAAAANAADLQKPRVQLRKSSVHPAELFARAMLTKSAVATEHVRLQEHHQFFKEFFEGFDNPVVSNMRQYRELDRWRRKNLDKHHNAEASTPLNATVGPLEPSSHDKPFYGHSHPQLLALLYEWTSVEQLVENTGDESDAARASAQADYVFAMRYVPRWRIRQVPLVEYPKHLRHDHRHVPPSLWKNGHDSHHKKKLKASSRNGNASSFARHRTAIGSERRGATGRRHEKSRKFGRTWTPAELCALDAALAAHKLATLGPPTGTVNSPNKAPAALRGQQVSKRTWQKVAEHVLQTISAARVECEGAKTSKKGKAREAVTTHPVTPDDCRNRYEQGLADRRLLVHYKCMYFFYKNDWRLVPITKNFSSSTPAAGAKSVSSSPEAKTGGSTTFEGNSFVSGVGPEELELLLDPAQQGSMTSHSPSRVGQALARLLLATTATFADPFEADATFEHNFCRITAPHFELPTHMVAAVCSDGVSSGSGDSVNCGRVFAAALHRGDGAVETSSADTQLAIGLGSRVQGFWEETQDWYDGVVTDIRTPPTEFFVQFDDGDESWLHPSSVRKVPWPVAETPHGMSEPVSTGSACNGAVRERNPCHGGSPARGTPSSASASPRVLPAPLVGEDGRSSPSSMLMSGTASPSQLSPSSSALAITMLQRNALGGQFTDVASKASQNSVDHLQFAATNTPGCSAQPRLPFQDPSQQQMSSRVGLGPANADWFVQAASTLEAATSGLGQRQWWGKNTQDSVSALELKLTSAQNSSARRKRSGARGRKARTGDAGNDGALSGATALRSTTGKRRASSRNAHDAETMAFGSGGGDLVSRQKRLRFGKVMLLALLGKLITLQSSSDQMHTQAEALFMRGACTQTKRCMLEILFWSIKENSFGSLTTTCECATTPAEECLTTCFA